MNISRFPLPKSRLARVFLVSFVLVILGFILLFFTAPNPSSNIKESTQTLSKNDEAKKIFKEELNKDSDNDGLKDWEEAVYHTDPHNPDTDGDGTPDGEEVKNNRNPLTKGPNDKVLPAEENPVTFVFDNKNLTHLFTQKLIQNPDFQNILSSNKAGIISPHTIEQYVNELPLTAALQDPPLPNPKTLSISNDESPKAISDYLNDLFAVYLRHNDAFSQGDDLTIFKNALEKNDPNEWKKLARMIVTLDAIIREANTLSIPQKIVWFHQKEIQLLTKTRNELTALQNVQNDPLEALTALRERIQTKTALTKLHQEELPRRLETAGDISLDAKAYMFFIGKIK